MHGCNLWTSYGPWLEKARPRLGPHAAAMASDAASLHRHLASDPRYACCLLGLELGLGFRVRVREQQLLSLVRWFSGHLAPRPVWMDVR